MSVYRPAQELLDQIGSEADPFALASAIVTQLRNIAAGLAANGQTETQIQNTLLTTYGPLLAAICYLRGSAAIIRVACRIETERQSHANLLSGKVRSAV